MTRWWPQLRHSLTPSTWTTRTIKPN